MLTDYEGQIIEGLMKIPQTMKNHFVDQICFILKMMIKQSFGYAGLICNLSCGDPEETVFMQQPVCRVDQFLLGVVHAILFLSGSAFATGLRRKQTKGALSQYIEHLLNSVNQMLKKMSRLFLE